MRHLDREQPTNQLVRFAGGWRVWLHPAGHLVIDAPGAVREPVVTEFPHAGITRYVVRAPEQAGSTPESKEGTSVADLGLTVETRELLAARGIHTLEELVEMSAAALGLSTAPTLEIEWALHARGAGLSPA